jgi:hypothetical protein
MRVIGYYRRAFGIFLREPAFRALGLAALAVLVVGTAFYRYMEGWSWVDSLYFCTVTLATIGYGDFTPSTSEARLFTVVYILLGFGIVGAFLNLLVRAPLIMQDRDPSIRLRDVSYAESKTPPSPPDPPPRPAPMRKVWRRREHRVRRISG